MTDTLELFKKLTKAGMTEAQAELLVTALWEMQYRPSLDLASNQPSRLFPARFWRWYLRDMSRHPALNGMLTGLAIAAIENAILFPLFDLVPRLCSHR
ncbi:hypothetical protein [Paraburkholderia hospita]|uniref:hypothetical protein n=1 Tax=Paraburkholderia hospita TaxID=169430 RepID=UPI00131A2B0C|nr:hypothetical protein [Paraburkholderia hospita]